MPRVDPRTGLKQCTKCYQYKLAHEFPESSNDVDGRRAWCTLCTKTTRAFWSDPARVRLHAKLYNGSNGTRVKRLSDGTVTVAALQMMFESWTGTCPLCGKRAEPAIDHITPLSHGGKHTLENVRLICRNCNNKKGAR